jgi:hypothetical protein
MPGSALGQSWPQTRSLALTALATVVSIGAAKKARDLATCDGPPDYTYKAAYDEAGALLAQLNKS